MKETIQFGHGAGQHPDADQISAFVEHVLTAHEREEMLAHLAACPECRATVRLSQTGVEGVPEPVEEPRRRPWFAGWGLAWPAGAAVAAMLVLGVYLQHEATLRNRKNADEQMAMARAPERPVTAKEPNKEKEAKSAGTPGMSTGTAAFEDKSNLRGAIRAKEIAGAPAAGGGSGGTAPSFAVARQIPMTADKHVEGLARPVSPAGEQSLAKTPSPSPAPAEPQQANASGAVTRNFAALAGISAGKAGGSIGGPALKKAEAVEAQLTLPSGQPVLSSARHGRQVVAIDARNAVFASADSGEHWTEVSTAWTGRAVKADLVSYGINGGAAAAGGMVAQLHSRSPAPSPQQRQQTDVEAQSAGQNALVSQAQGREPAAQAQSTPGSAPVTPAPAPVQNQEQSATAQIANGELTGTVKDTSGVAIPGAKVTVTDSADHTTQTATAGADGRYVLDRLTPGSYDMKTQAPGFEPQTTKDVAVKQSQTNVTDVALRVGAASETVTVEADRIAGLETESMTLSPTGTHKAKTARTAKAEAAPIFEITTENGDKWTSADGMTWKRK